MAANKVLAFRDPESGWLVMNDKRGKKMPRAQALAALDRMLAERRQPQPVGEPTPF